MYESHHQPINVPTAGAQAFLIDHLQGERVITLHAGPVRIGGCKKIKIGLVGVKLLNYNIFHKMSFSFQVPS
jgi:hypothetical protein